MKQFARLVAALCVALAWPAAAAAQAAPDYKTWYLAEGATGFFEEYVLIGNPNNAPAQVEIRYLLPSELNQPAPAPRNITVGARSRATVRVNDDVPTGSVSVVVTSSVPVVVERSMYWGGPTLRGGHNATAVPAPALDWYLPEGASTAFFDQFILIANPNGVAVQVEVDYLGTDGIKDTATYSVAANSRRTINAAVDIGQHQFPGRNFRNREFSARVRSLDPAAPIIVERAMYWGNIFTGGPNPGGTAAAGLTRLSDTWRFAEGMTAAGFQTFVLLMNPSDVAVTVDTTFFLEDGTTEVITNVVPPNSRENIWVNASANRAGNAPFSILVQARNGAQIAAERAMYWGGFREGHAVGGILDEAPRWAFAEGVEDWHGGVDFDTYFLLNNSTDNTASVTAYFVREDGTGITRTFTINPRSRYTLGTGQFLELSNQGFAAFFDSTVPIVAERATYWGQGYYGGHASAGIPWPAAFDFAGLPAPPAATVASISPAAGLVGTTVTVRGANFARDAQVRVGGTPAEILGIVDSRTIVIRVPNATVGAKSVVVTSRGANAASPQDFTYETPPPPPPPPPPPTTGTQAVGPAVAEFCNIADPKAGAPATAIYRSMCSGPTRTGALPLNFFGIVNQLANERRDLLLASCVKTGGNINFIVELVRRLRDATGTNRWGLNYKRGGEGISDDIVTYFYGGEGEEMEGDLRVYIIDVIGNHCPISGSPGPNWQDQTNATRSGGTVGRWTTAGRL